ncbi:MAG: hypothetical protein R3B47_21000 [Bacteroidia bacterium]
MKKIIPLLFYTCFIYASLAQNWAPIHPDEKYNYRRDSADVITHTLWVDSIGLVSGDTVMYMNTTLGPCDTCDWSDIFNDFFIQSPHFLQKQIVRIAPAHYQLRDTGLIDLQAFQPVGGTWLLEPRSAVTATVAWARDSLLWGQVIDSVKKLSLSDGGTILLSKAYGLLYYERPRHRFRLTGLQEGRVLGEQVPMFWDFYDMQVGDVFQFGAGKFRNLSGELSWEHTAGRIDVLAKSQLVPNIIQYEFLIRQV